jgi:hypothetical protein
MTSLYDELCSFKNDDVVKTTTVYPMFINTRKELGDFLDSFEDPVPRLTPEEAANEIVVGILNNQLDVTIPSNASIMTFIT